MNESNDIINAKIKEEIISEEIVVKTEDIEIDINPQEEPGDEIKIEQNHLNNFLESVVTVEEVKCETVDKNEIPFECNGCRKSFLKKFFDKHVCRVSDWKKHKCEHCGKTFLFSSNLKTHLITHERSEKSSFRERRPDDVPVEAKSIKKKPHVKNVTGKLRDKTFLLLAHEPYVCQERSGKSSRRERQPDDVPVEENAIKKNVTDEPQLDYIPVECKLCNKMFATRSALMKHFTVHPVQNPYPCKICHKRFMSNRDVRDHMVVHVGERLYQCNKCSIWFPRIGRLRSHMREHERRANFECDVCRKEFTTKRRFAQHKRFHEKEQVYHICDFKTH